MSKMHYKHPRRNAEYQVKLDRFMPLCGIKAHGVLEAFVTDEIEDVDCLLCLAHYDKLTYDDKHVGPELCDNCGHEVNVMAYRGTGLCSQNCAKDAFAEGWGAY